MASKVLVPAAPPPFTKLQVNKSPLEPAGFIITGDPAARAAHLEHSVRFLQEQHRLMLNGLHVEIEALRERNRDLQFQLIFSKESKESSPGSTSPPNEVNIEDNEEVQSLKSDVSRLEKEALEAKIEAQAANSHVVQLQDLVEMQAEKIRELQIVPKCMKCENAAAAKASGGEDNIESRAELRARLADAETLVRRLKTDADRRRRELLCVKNSLHASLRATGLDAYGFQNNYHFPPVLQHTPEFWREPIREDYSSSRGRCSRRTVVPLPELTSQQVHRSTIYVNHHTSRPRNGFDNKNKKPPPPAHEVTNGRIPEQEHPESRLSPNYTNLLPNINTCNVGPNVTFPELKIVVTKMIPHGNVSNSTVQPTDNGRARQRRPHRKHAADHT